LNNINENLINKDKHNIDKYLFTQVNTKINNKYKFTKVKQSYRVDDALNSQQLNFKKKSKIKVVQNFSLIKAKINKEVTQTNKDKAKLIIHNNFLNNIIKNNYSCRQKNVYKTTQQQRLNINAKSLFERK